MNSPYKLNAKFVHDSVPSDGLSGGISASMAGSHFRNGVCNGLICAGLNHALHLAGDRIKFYYELHKLICIPRQEGTTDCKYAIMAGITHSHGETIMKQND